MTAICLLSILYFPNIKLIFNGENLTFKKIYIYSPEVQWSQIWGVVRATFAFFNFWEREVHAQIP